MKMRNVGAFVTQGQLQCAFHVGSKWTPWYDTADTLAEDAQRRAANNTAGAPRTSRTPGTEQGSKTVSFDMHGAGVPAERVKRNRADVPNLRCRLGAGGQGGVGLSHAAPVAVLPHPPPGVLCSRGVTASCIVADCIGSQPMVPFTSLSPFPGVLETRALLFAGSCA